MQMLCQGNVYVQTDKQTNSGVCYTDDSPVLFTEVLHIVNCHQEEAGLTICSLQLQFLFLKG